MSAVAVAGWVLIAAAFIACSWWAHRSKRSFPSLGEFLRAVVGTRAGRWLVVVTWVWIGVHLFVRHG